MLYFPIRRWLNALLLITSLVLCQAAAVLSAPSPDSVSGNPGQWGKTPYLGWTSWNLEASKNSQYGLVWLNEANIKVQADAMRKILGPHGYQYINIDSDWCGGYDQYGRPITDLKRFPDGIAGLAAYLHKNGQKIGIYWIPGVQRGVYDQNPLILGTHYHIRDIVAQPLQAGNAFGDWHLKIDFTKPGAQEFIDSIAALWASWGIDYLKLDGVGPGSDSEIDSRDNVKAYYLAFKKTHRPIWLELSWRMDHNYVGFWQRFSNGRRVTDDIDSHDQFMTGWDEVRTRITEEPLWSEDAGPGKGWNDFDAMPVGNPSLDGLTDDERQSLVSFWAVECAPLYTGDDLTNLDELGLKLLTNDDVIAVDQAGRPAVQMVGGSQQIWRVDNGDGTYTLDLLNLGSESTAINANWDFLGFSGPQKVRDLWGQTDLGVFQSEYQTVLRPHASMLIRVGPSDPSSNKLPLVVTRLQTDAGAGSVSLTWNPSAGASRYTIWRSNALHSGYSILKTGVKKSAYTDRTVVNGQPYFYQVAATNSAGSSARSPGSFALPADTGHANAISVQFVGNGLSMDTDELAGVVPSMNWNCAPCRYGTIALSDSSGNDTGALLHYDAGGTYQTPIPDAPGNNRMMKGYLETYGTDTSKITVTSLPSWFTAHGYDVYLYTDGGNGKLKRVAKFTIGTTTIQATDSPNSDFNGVFSQTDPTTTYVKFTGLTGDSFTLQATPVSSEDTNLRAPINAIQIVAH